MSEQSSPSQVAKSEFGHPVLDADGHVLEFLPAVWPFLREALGPRLFDEYRDATAPVDVSVGGSSDPEWRRRTRSPQSAWWASPAANTRDLATAALPSLLHERMDELAIDVAALFPTKALGTCRIDEPDMRRGVCRGFNDYFAETYRPYSDRLRPVGVIPMHDPQEAVNELRHCAEIGLGAVAIPEGVWRPIPEPADPASIWLVPGQTHWFDNFGLDSAHDYDPVWAEFERLGYAVLSHGGLGHVAPNQYISISNYSANHIGSFRDKMFQLCKSLFMSGVTRRFPDLRFGFMECGVAWATSLLADLVEHWEKRNPVALAHLDPAAIDHAELEALFRRYGGEMLREVDDLRGALDRLPAVGSPPAERDDWRFLDVDSVAELVELFAPRMYFGCEADDRGIAVAFSVANPGGRDLQPVFSSDIAHWDVDDMAAVVAEAWSLVDHGVITEDQFRRVVLDNPLELLGERFVRGTVLESTPARS